MKLILEVKDCRTCPYKYDYIGHGECWIECRHPDLDVKPYEEILWGCKEQFTKVPDWCPIKKSKQK